MYGFTPQFRRRDVWAEALRLYDEHYREGNEEQAYDALCRHWRAGNVVPVKVTLLWETK